MLAANPTIGEPLSPRRSRSGVPAEALFRWLVVLVGAQCWRWLLWTAGLPGPAPLLSALLSVSVIYYVEWFYVLRLLTRPAASHLVPVAETVAVLTYFTFAMMVAGPDARLLAVPEAVYLAIRFRFSPSLKLAGTCLLLMVLQLFAMAKPLDVADDVVAGLDAAVVGHVLLLLKFPVAISAHIIQSLETPHGIDVRSGCASTHGIALVVSSFLIIVLARRGRWHRHDLRWLVLLVFGIFLVNWLRLGPMALSTQGYEYWHYGDGAAIVSFADFCLTLIAATAATKRDGPLARKPGEAAIMALPP